MLDETLQKILGLLAPEDNLGVLLAAQLGGTPQEIQLIIQTTDFIDPSDDYPEGALKPSGEYIIRAINVVEHKLSLGLFRNLVQSDSNALLYQHNQPIMQVAFTGKTEQVDSLMIDLNQLYGQTYGIYEPSRRMAEEINPTQPLATLLSSGEGILGGMPLPFAQKVVKVLAKYDLTATLSEMDTHRPNFEFQALVMDDSYVIAQLFSADPMGTRQKPT